MRFNASILRSRDLHFNIIICKGRRSHDILRPQEHKEVLREANDTGVKREIARIGIFSLCPFNSRTDTLNAPCPSLPPTGSRWPQANTDCQETGKTHTATG